MLMVISPAKALNLAPPPARAAMTAPALAGDIAVLAEVTRKLTARKLMALMGISDKLAALNAARFAAFDPAGEEGLQAVFAFNGDVYLGLKARELDRAALAWAQDHLAILSGLYGLLRPLDAIQPYRLEMGSRLKTRRGADLYAFWGDRIARRLNEAAEGQADPTLVNLASQEYFRAVDRDALKLPVVACHFKEARAGGLLALGYAAKRARGLMARYAIDSRAERAEDLKAFAVDGFRFRPEASTDTDWAFVRAAA
ncbi:MAG: peroxide stress protein YaaA [Caulobacteraceae bacterium]